MKHAVGNGPVDITDKSKHPFHSSVCSVNFELLPNDAVPAAQYCYNSISGKIFYNPRKCMVVFEASLIQDPFVQLRIVEKAGCLSCRVIRGSGTAPKCTWYPPYGSEYCAQAPEGTVDGPTDRAVFGRVLETLVWA